MTKLIYIVMFVIMNIRRHICGKDCQNDVDSNFRHSKASSHQYRTLSEHYGTSLPASIRRILLLQSIECSSRIVFLTYPSPRSVKIKKARSAHDEATKQRNGTQIRAGTILLGFISIELLYRSFIMVVLSSLMPFLSRIKMVKDGKKFLKMDLSCLKPLC